MFACEDEIVERIGTHSVEKSTISVGSRNKHRGKEGARGNGRKCVWSQLKNAKAGLEAAGGVWEQ